MTVKQAYAILKSTYPDIEFRNESFKFKDNWVFGVKATRMVIDAHIFMVTPKGEVKTIGVSELSVENGDRKAFADAARNLIKFM